MIERFKKRRLEMNDAYALSDFGAFYAEGQYGLPQNYNKALELWHRAGELGHSGAYFNIGTSYEDGRGVGRDEQKANYYYELGAMVGDVNARHKLQIRH